MWEEHFSDYTCESCGVIKRAETMYTSRLNKSLVLHNPEEGGETSNFRGKEHWFCSDKCRDHYLVFNDG